MAPCALAQGWPYLSSHPNLFLLLRQGVRVIPNGQAWQQHLLLMIVSAKLLADTEVALQMQTSPGPAGSATASGAPRAGAGSVAAIAALMKPTVPPVRYLMTQLTQFGQPLVFPDHGTVMEVRSLRAALSREKRPTAQRDLHRKACFRLLQLRQVLRRQQRVLDMHARATKAGAKVTPEMPRIAARARPAMHREATWRYRVPEAGDGWVVRPTVEPHGAEHYGRALPCP
jgi:hypothetical protein